MAVVVFKIFFSTPRSLPNRKQIKLETNAGKLQTNLYFVFSSYQKKLRSLFLQINASATHVTVLLINIPLIAIAVLNIS